MLSDHCDCDGIRQAANSLVHDELIELLPLLLIPRSSGILILPLGLIAFLLLDLLQLSLHRLDAPLQPCLRLFLPSPSRRR